MLVVLSAECRCICATCSCVSTKLCRERKDDEDFCIQIRRVTFAETDL
jgi:hypothetical protein